MFFAIFYIKVNKHANVFWKAFHEGKMTLKLNETKRQHLSFTIIKAVC